MFRFCLAFLAFCGPAYAGDPIKVLFSVEDPRLIAGIEYARDLYNASACPVAQRTSENPCKPLSSEDYIFFVARSAIESYAASAERVAKLNAAGIE
jgi:hypothetical protein